MLTDYIKSFGQHRPPQEALWLKHIAVEPIFGQGDGQDIQKAAFPVELHRDISQKPLCLLT